MANEINTTPFFGVNFANLRKALYLVFFGVKGSETFESENYKYIIPMQASWENPLNAANATDTYIQYWIERDEELTQDDLIEEQEEGMGWNRQKRVASVLLRFVGRQAEAWSKVFYHMNTRKDITPIWSGVCNAEKLLYTSPCIPHRIDYFGKNTSIAFDVRFKLYYDEVISTGWQPLEGIKFTFNGALTVED